MIDEFELIQRYFAKSSRGRTGTLVPIGDDCALVQTEGKKVAVSTDTMIEGVHFSSWTSPDSVGHKLATVNLSDMAACSAHPKWATLNLSIPEIKHDWLSGFSSALLGQLERYGVELIGGDTCCGALQLSLTLLGEVSKEQFTTRDTAEVGDYVYVTGTLGDCRLALEIEKALWGGGSEARPPVSSISKTYQALLHKFNYPEPRLSLGQALFSCANAMIDVSDGLIQDTQHLLRPTASQTDSALGIELFSQKIPLSDAFLASYQEIRELNTIIEKDQEMRHYAMASGEEYELCFTVPPNKIGALEKISHEHALPISQIGYVNNSGLVSVDGETTQTLKEQGVGFGYRHFCTAADYVDEANTGNVQK